MRLPVPGGPPRFDINVSNRVIWAVVLVISLGWGTAPVAVRIALREGFGTFTIAAVTSMIAAAAVFLLIARRRQERLVGRLELRMGAVLSIISVLVPFQTRNAALDNASAGFVSLAGALVPLVTAVIAHFMLDDEPLKLPTLAGLLLGLAGVAVLLLGGDSGIAEGGNPTMAGVLVIISVLSMAAAAVYAKRYAGRYSVLGVTGVQLVIGSAVLTLLALPIEGLPVGYSGAGWISLLYAGVFGTFVTLALYYYLIRHVTVTYSTIISYIIPFIAVLAGVLVLDEELQPGITIGGALVLLGLLVTDLIRIRASRRPAAGGVGR